MAFNLLYDCGDSITAAAACLALPGVWQRFVNPHATEHNQAILVLKQGVKRHVIGAVFG